MADKIKNPIMIACTVIVTVIAVSGVLYACGAIAGQVDDNKESVKVGASERKELRSEIVELKIFKERQLALGENTLKTLTSLDTTLKAIQAVQTKQATVQAINSTKLDTLTKDE